MTGKMGVAISREFWESMVHRNNNCMTLFPPSQICEVLTKRRAHFIPNTERAN